MQPAPGHPRKVQRIAVRIVTIYLFAVLHGAELATRDADLGLPLEPGSMPADPARLLSGRFDLFDGESIAV